MNNFFEGDDFSVIAMTEAINTLDIVPSRIGAMGLFQGGGITTTAVGIEQTNNQLTLVPTAPRGTMPEYKSNVKRALRAIQVPHLPKNDTVIADSVQNIRAFGNETELASVSDVVNQKLLALKQDHELTWEYHRIGALQGKIKDADGVSTVVDLHAEFGVARITINWNTSNALGLKTAAVALRRTMETELNLLPYTQINVECSEGFWDALISSTETRDAYNRYQDNSFAREQNGQDFMYSGINFRELRGSVGANPLVPTDEAFAYPITRAPGLYQQRFAPAPFMETVNTVGKPYYAKQEALRFNSGVEIHTNSNPLFLVTKPRVLIRLTMSV